MAGGFVWGSRKIYYDEVLSRSIAKKADFEFDVAKHFPKLASNIAGSTVVDGETTSPPKPVSSQAVVGVLAAVGDPCTWRWWSSYAKDSGVPLAPLIDTDLAGITVAVDGDCDLVCGSQV